MELFTGAGLWLKLPSIDSEYNVIPSPISEIAEGAKGVQTIDRAAWWRIVHSILLVTSIPAYHTHSL